MSTYAIPMVEPTQNKSQSLQIDVLALKWDYKVKTMRMTLMMTITVRVVLMIFVSLSQPLLYYLRMNNHLLSKELYVG